MIKRFKELLFTLFVVSLFSIPALFGMKESGFFAHGEKVGDSKEGKVVIVSGPSSCGKSLVTEALVKRLMLEQKHGKVWVRIALDDVSKRVDEQDRLQCGKYVSKLERKNKNKHLSYLYFLLIDDIKRYTDMGVNVVLDVVFDEEEGCLGEFLAQLFKKGKEKVELEKIKHRFLSVFLHCSFETLIQRVFVRNKLKDQEERRNAWFVLGGYAKMTKQVSLDEAAQHRNVLERISPLVFDKVIQEAAKISKEQRGVEQFIDNLKAQMGLDKLKSDDEIVLIPKANYDCSVRSDKHANDKVEKNVDDACSGIFSELQVKFKESSMKDKVSDEESEGESDTSN